jgi:alginate O-acetyltransferase complex protein AlgI
MAIGLARMLGFHFLENFNYPYISKSIQDFWRRWHISLSSWFRDYVYIPLGGNRKGSKRTYVNLAIVFFATGLWHGASWNFIFWGLYHGLFLIIERLGFSKVLQRIWSPLAHIYTLLVVVIGWVFFRANTLTDAIAYLKKMFFISKSSVMPSLNLFYFFNRETIVVFTLGIIFSMPVFPVLRERMAASFPKVTLLKQGYYLTLLGLLVFLMMFLAVDTYNPFIYFRF